MLMALGSAQARGGVCVLRGAASSPGNGRASIFLVKQEKLWGQWEGGWEGEGVGDSPWEQGQGLSKAQGCGGLHRCQECTLAHGPLQPTRSPGCGTLKILLMLLSHFSRV